MRGLFASWGCSPKGRILQAHYGALRRSFRQTPRRFPPKTPLQAHGYRQVKEKRIRTLELTIEEKQLDEDNQEEE